MNLGVLPSALPRIFSSKLFPCLATKAAVLSTTARTSGGGRIRPVTLPCEAFSSSLSMLCRRVEVSRHCKM